MYGSGLRLMEAVRLRVKDIDFDYCCIRGWNGKGRRHRTVALAPELKAELHVHVLQMGGSAVRSPFSGVKKCLQDLLARYSHDCSINILALGTRYSVSTF